MYSILFIPFPLFYSFHSLYSIPSILTLFYALNPIAVRSIAFTQVKVRIVCGPDTCVDSTGTALNAGIFML